MEQTLSDYADYATEIARVMVDNKQFSPKQTVSSAMLSRIYGAKHRAQFWIYESIG